MVTQYTAEIGQDILNKCHQRGWNVYAKRNLFVNGPDKVIQDDLVEMVEVNGSYVLLPLADNPRKPDQVQSALENLAQKLNRQMPTIEIMDDRYPITGFTLHSNDVKVHTPEGIHVDYPTFLNALPTLVKTND